MFQKCYGTDHTCLDQRTRTLKTLADHLTKRYQHVCADHYTRRYQYARACYHVSNVHSVVVTFGVRSIVTLPYLAL